MTQEISYNTPFFTLKGFFTQREKSIKLIKLDLELLENNNKVVLENKGYGEPYDFIMSQVVLLLNPKTGSAKENEIRKALKPYLIFNKVSPLLQSVLVGLGEKVEKGKITTYKNLALTLGLGANYTRVVAKAMSSNPFPLLYPCHRVVPFNYTLGKKFGVKGGLAVKKRLLINEGILFNHEKIEMK